MTARATMRAAALAATLLLLAARASLAADVEVHEAGVGFRSRAGVPNLPLGQGDTEANLYFGKAARWLPFEAVLEGRGEPVEGTLVLREEPLLDRAPVEYRRRVSLGARGKKRFSFPVFSKYEASYALTLEIDGGGSATLGLGRKLAIDGPREVGGEASLVLVVTARTSAFTHLLHRLGPEEYGEDRVIIPVPPAGLPLDAVAYDGVDVVVLDDVPLAEISERAAAALAQHVARGGVLVVSLRESTAGAAGSPLEPLLPGVPDGLETLSAAPALASATGEPCLFEPPQAVTAFALREGAVPWASGSRAIAHRRHDRGTVVALGFSLAAPYMVRWPGASLLMDSLCDARRAPLLELPGRARARIFSKEIADTLRDSMVKPMPPFRIVAWSLVSYALVVLVLPYAVFRRVDRLEWAWAAILGISLAGAAAVYVIGGRYLGAESYAHRVSVVECAGGGGPALRHSRWALFSADGGKVDIAFDSSTAVPSPLPDERDPNASVEALRVSTDAARACSLLTHTQDSSLFETTEEETLTGRVRFGSDLRFARDGDFPIGRAWVLDSVSAEEVSLGNGLVTRLSEPGRLRDIVVKELRGEADRFLGSAAACVLEEVGDAARRRGRPVLVFQYEGAPGLKGSHIRERGLSFAIVEAEAPRPSECTAWWVARPIAVHDARAADGDATEFLLGAEIPPGFDFAVPLQLSLSIARERRVNFIGAGEVLPTVFEERSRTWISWEDVSFLDGAGVRRTPLGQAYLRARTGPTYESIVDRRRSGQVAGRWRFDVSVQLERRAP